MNLEDWLRHHPRMRNGFVAAAPLDVVLSEYDVVQPDVLYFEPHRLQDLSAHSAIRLPPDVAIRSPI